MNIGRSKTEWMKEEVNKNEKGSQCNAFSLVQYLEHSKKISTDSMKK